MSRSYLIFFSAFRTVTTLALAAQIQKYIFSINNGFQLYSQPWNRANKQVLHTSVWLKSIGSTSEILGSGAAGFQLGNIKNESDRFRDSKVVFASDSDVISWNAMISSYARSGRIEDARHVFDKMSKRSIVSWNAMITGYANNGRINEARYLFDRMPQRDVVSWNAMISSYVRSGRIEDARQMFDEMPERDAISWNSMVSGYARNGLVEEARRLFEEMPQKNLVSWNAMLAGYIQNGRMEDASLFFEGMIERDAVSWNSMITGYAQKGEIVNARSMFDAMPARDIASWNAMISGYVQNGLVFDARQVFDRATECDVVSWTAMIAGCAQDGRIDDARGLFDKMPERNVISWNAMIAGYAQNGRMECACHLFDRMPERNVSSWNVLIAGYAQNGRIEDSFRVFSDMPKRDVISWTAMIAAYVQNGYGEEALKLFSKMKQLGVKVNQSAITSILSACASLAALEEGRQVHNHIIKTGFELGILVGNALITMYCKCGSIDEGYHMFDKMTERDVISWNAMIAGYSQHGCGKEALKLFELMQQAGTKPDHITLVGVLSACSHAGLVHEGWHYFDSMVRDHGITAKVEHYACMVDLLGRSGHLDEAEDFVNKMPFEPNASTWGALLGASRIHGNMDLGIWAAEQLFELEPQNAGMYVLLSNMYAAVGRWDNVQRLRAMMKDRGVKKEPGCSWIEIKHKVHAFLVGDKSHPQTDKIYAMLERLAGQMKKIGYLPATNFVLHNVEEEQKEHMLCHHSEKLAVAFGLLNTPNGTAIRIIKNLRVCGDCHTAMKFISKIVEREIVIRDTNRFHHFNGGICSCGDYW